MLRAGPRPATRPPPREDSRGPLAQSSPARSWPRQEPREPALGQAGADGRFAGRKEAAVRQAPKGAARVADGDASAGLGGRPHAPGGRALDSRGPPPAGRRTTAAEVPGARPREAERGRSGSAISLGEGVSRCVRENAPAPRPRVPTVQFTASAAAVPSVPSLRQRLCRPLPLPSCLHPWVPAPSTRPPARASSCRAGQEDSEGAARAGGPRLPPRGLGTGWRVCHGLASQGAGGCHPGNARGVQGAPQRPLSGRATGS